VKTGVQKGLKNWIPAFAGMTFLRLKRTFSILFCGDKGDV
jgi:hypothetical protein